ncbi:MAG: Mth938-like domain-containing protein [Alphaproteobacteria bacterium]
MDITPVIPKTLQTITGYGDGGFKINGEHVSGSLLVYAETVTPWAVQSAGDIDFKQLAEWCAQRTGIELLLLGSGISLLQPPPQARQILRQQGIALEVMNTGAACRTYNVLLAEERKVAAALVAL